MTSNELLKFYSNRSRLFSEQLATASKKINQISNARLAVAILFLVALYFGLRSPALLYTLPVFLAVFILLVRAHSKFFDQRLHLKNLVSVNTTEIQVLRGDVSALHPGTEFTNTHHPYAHDLDIFGDGSLYQHLNRCNTLNGRKKFAHHLADPLRAADDIVLRQSAIRELSEQTDFLQQFQAAGMEMEELPEDREQLLSWTRRPTFVFGKKAYRLVLVIVPLLTIALIVASFFSVVFRPFAFLAAAIQWGFIGIHMKRITAFHDYISRKKNILKKYSRLLHFLQRQSFNSPLMARLQAHAKDADQKVARFASLVSIFDARLNSMTMLVVNSILLFDLQCVYRLEKWKEANAGDFEKWLEAVNEAEVLSSFGTYAFNNSLFIYPEITDSLSISAKQMGHPLINPEDCVVNDVQLGGDHQVLIVTGANMAGKSTFLRTLGVNMVLALNGAPVFATEFRCPVIQLRTGMRTADSLKDHQSYFYAELDRLQGIMHDLREDIPLLILLDEILKGTNSTDKQTGSIALVKQLLPHSCLAVIATHDLALGDLEKEFPDNIKNYCFEANIQNDQLYFDYKLKPGLATKMNATFLMKKMGIIPA